MEKKQLKASNAEKSEKVRHLEHLVSEKNIKMLKSEKNLKMFKKLQSKTGKDGKRTPRPDKFSYELSNWNPANWDGAFNATHAKKATYGELVPQKPVCLLKPYANVKGSDWDSQLSLHLENCERAVKDSCLTWITVHDMDGNPPDGIPRRNQHTCTSCKPGFFLALNRHKSRVGSCHRYSEKPQLTCTETDHDMPLLYSQSVELRKGLNVNTTFSRWKASNRLCTKGALVVTQIPVKGQDHLVQYFSSAKAKQSGQAKDKQSDQAKGKQSGAKTDAVAKMKAKKTAAKNGRAGKARIMAAQEKAAKRVVPKKQKTKHKAPKATKLAKGKLGEGKTGQLARLAGGSDLLWRGAVAFCDMYKQLLCHTEPGGRSCQVRKMARCRMICKVSRKCVHPNYISMSADDRGTSSSLQNMKGKNMEDKKKAKHHFDFKCHSLNINSIAKDETCCTSTCDRSACTEAVMNF